MCMIRFVSPNDEEDEEEEEEDEAGDAVAL